ncbi:unnamed protein product [Soboliphyme baturini]|uniref:Asparagine synthetase domain-containing protein n=1 Tax=Soboliphyme baturini TaxID=241478 RepID=A0A183JAN8_9BILA|nr:unnamed protein product [Soboliphyme baturini]
MHGEIVGANAVKALRVLFPDRKWNFVEVTVDRAELMLNRNEHIKHSLKPMVSVIDDSIGCALWFAARGRGTVNGKKYISPAKYVYIGMGSDELLAGYSRHRQVFRTGGWKALAQQLKIELSRMWERNSGRDDRVFFDNCRVSLLPYVDEDFVAAVNQLPIWVKADLRYKRGIGEKIILRAALWKLGFGSLAFGNKIAIQFGSRIAKFEKRSEKGSDICDRLL